MLEEAAQVWAKAQVVFEAPSWEGEPPARALVEQVATVPDCHSGLVTLLSSPNQLVVAHALQALELMRSPVLAELPDELCDRRQKVTFQCGSFRNSMDLGGYARQVRGPRYLTEHDLSLSHTQHGSVAYFGLIDVRTQAEVPSARMSDTPQVIRLLALHASA